MGRESACRSVDLKAYFKFSVFPSQYQSMVEKDKKALDLELTPGCMMTTLEVRP